MLALTRGAADVAEAIVAESERPDSAVLRIATRPRDENGGGHPELELVLVDRPAKRDLLLDEGPVAIDPATAELLDDKILDATIEGTEVRFSIVAENGDHA